MRFGLPRRRIWRAGIYFVCALLVLLALDLWWAQSRRTIRPGYATTRIIAPKLPDGSIDYVTAVETYFGRGVTPQNNAAPLLLQAFGRAALPRTQPPDGITNRLGMPHLPEKGNYFIEFDVFAKSHGDPAAAEEFNRPNSRNLPLPDSPLTVAWLKANEKPLALIQQATKRRRFFIPFNGGNHPEIMLSIPLKYVNCVVWARIALLTRAPVRLASGDPTGCIEDLLSLHRLARLMGQAPTLVERTVGMATEITTCELDRQIAASGKLSARQLGDLARALSFLHEFPSPADSIDIAERYMMLDTTQACARANPARAGELYQYATGWKDVPPPELFRFLPIPYEQTTIVANHFYDGLLAAMRQPTYAQRHAAIDLYGQNLQAQTSHVYPRILSPDWALRIFLTALGRVQQKWETARAQLALSRAAVALAAYKGERGGFPGTLSELSPDYLPSVPDDNFTGRPLIYLRAGDGYKLYSVGPNMIDDGANPESGDDIAANAPNGSTR